MTTTTTTTTDLANVPHPAGAVRVADWYDMEFGIDHVRRYFSGSSRVVQIDGAQGPDGDVTRMIMVVDGNMEALELKPLERPDANPLLARDV